MDAFVWQLERFKQMQKNDLDKWIDWLKYVYTEYHPIARPGLKVIREQCDVHARRYLSDIDIDVLAQILYDNLRLRYHEEWNVDSVLTEYLKAHKEIR